MIDEYQSCTRSQLYISSGAVLEALDGQGSLTVIINYWIGWVQNPIFPNAVLIDGLMYVTRTLLELSLVKKL